MTDLRGLPIHEVMNTIRLELAHCQNYREVATTYPVGSERNFYLQASGVASDVAGMGTRELANRFRLLVPTGGTMAAGWAFLSLPLTAIAAGGIGCLAIAGVAVIGAGAVGYGIGTTINEAIGL